MSMQLLLGDKKKLATVIVATLGKDRSKSEYSEKMYNDDIPEDNQLALEAAMDGFLRAIDRKDAKAMASSLKDFLDICNDETEHKEKTEIKPKEY